MSHIAARDLTLAYDREPVCRDLTLEIPDGSFTAIIGPNGCGKSTLLKALVRVLRPVSGQVLLDGRPIRSYPGKQIARRLALLPQSPIAPDAIRVADLVRRGRHPYHSLLRQWSPTDQEAVEEAIAVTGIGELNDRPVAELSGGQRQRVWVAMVLAQRTPTLLLDEPTTFLDIAHQYDLLQLFTRLQHQGRTVVAVLHDLNQAARFADHLVLMHDGAIAAQGPPESVLTEEYVRDVFDLEAVVVPDPQTGAPMVVPRAAPDMSHVGG